MSVAANLNDALKNYLLTALSVKVIGQNKEEAKEIAEWCSLLGSVLDSNSSEACESILQFISERYSISSLAWLERLDDRLEMICAVGKLQAQQVELKFSSDDQRLLDAAAKEISLEARGWENAEKNGVSQTIHLFPVAAGGEVLSALVIGDENVSANTKRHISRFCRFVASEFEILRLREELNKRSFLVDAVGKFNARVKDIDADDFWASLAQISAELLRAERCSLLIFDEKTNALSVKAATGASARILKNETGNFGERIAHEVLQNGEPLLIEDLRKTGISPAPAEWIYQSDSFISYPIIIGQRKIGVLNLTDRADGEKFSEFDLEILNAIMPQLAVLTDSAMLRLKSGEFEHLSVTDALTGLLNRLYLDERLPEEIRRSHRDNFPVSFLMIDVDNFKSYNDSFGHTEGDKALRLVAHCLKDTLRGADVAVRYGGEEFSILLPQTMTEEAAAIGERLREKVESTEFPNRQITVSIGVAGYLHNFCSAEELIKRADEALYEAKRSGRNNVKVYSAGAEFDSSDAEKRRALGEANTIGVSAH